MGELIGVEVDKTKYTDMLADTADSNLLFLLAPGSASTTNQLKVIGLTPTGVPYTESISMLPDPIEG